MHTRALNSCEQSCPIRTRPMCVAACVAVCVAECVAECVAVYVAVRGVVCAAVRDSA